METQTQTSTPPVAPLSKSDCEFISTVATLLHAIPHGEQRRAGMEAILALVRVFDILDPDMNLGIECTTTDGCEYAISFRNSPASQTVIVNPTTGNVSRLDVPQGVAS